MYIPGEWADEQSSNEFEVAVWNGKQFYQSVDCS